MKFIFLIMCMLLLFYRFDTVMLLSKPNNTVVIWRIAKDKCLLHIFPHNVHILVDNPNYYLYLERQNEETYVPAINLQNNYRVHIVNYMHLREWTDHAPTLTTYPSDLTDIFDIITMILR